MQWKGDIIEGFETEREYVGGGVTSLNNFARSLSNLLSNLLVFRMSSTLCLYIVARCIYRVSSMLFTRYHNKMLTQAIIHQLSPDGVVGVVTSAGNKEGRLLVSTKQET